MSLKFIKKLYTYLSFERRDRLSNAPYDHYYKWHAYNKIHHDIRKILLKYLYLTIVIYKYNKINIGKSFQVYRPFDNII